MGEIGKASPTLSLPATHTTASSASCPGLAQATEMWAAVVSRRPQSGRSV